MRMMLALQAFVAFGFLFIPARLYFLAAYETEQKSLLEPIQVDGRYTRDVPLLHGPMDGMRILHG